VTAKKSFIPTTDQPHLAITVRRIYSIQPDEERIVKALKIVVGRSMPDNHQGLMAQPNAPDPEKVWPVE
jgi:hypothetical protein